MRFRLGGSPGNNAPFSQYRSGNLLSGATYTKKGAEGELLEGRFCYGG